MQIEKRYLTDINDTEIRVKEGSRKVVGRGIVFNSWSHDLGGFIERIKPDAVDERLLTDPNIVSAVQHNLEKIMGRVGAGTLRLKKTTRGVNYEFDAPNTTAGNDLLESISRGDINGSSFVFRLAPGGQAWEEAEEGEPWKRTITKIGEIREIGPVVGEAYPDTTVAKRSLEEAQKEEIKVVVDDAPAFNERLHELRRKQILI